MPTPPPDGSKFITEDGSSVEDQTLRNWALHCFNNYVDKDKIPDGEHVLNFVEENPPIYATNSEAKVRADRAVLTATYVVNWKVIPIEFRSYFDRALSRSLTEAAVALIEVGGKPSSLVLPKGANGMIKASLVSSAT